MVERADPHPPDLDHRPGGVGGIDFALHPGRLDTESRDVGFFAYVDLATGGIGFAHTAGVGPTPVTVEADIDSDQNTFAGPSVSFDSSENFFVAYVFIVKTGSPQDTVSVRLKSVVDIEKGTFSNPPAIIDGPSRALNVRTPTSIARTLFTGCVAYFDLASKTLKASIADPSVGQALLETVAANLNGFVTPSAAARQNQFRVAFADADAVKLASRSDAGVWTIETVEAVSAASPSLAYDNSGTANIAYSAGGKVRYARGSA